jgi:hypothetical protein
MIPSQYHFGDCMAKNNKDCLVVVNCGMPDHRDTNPSQPDNKNGPHIPMEDALGRDRLFFWLSFSYFFEPYDKILIETAPLLSGLPL